MQRLFTRLAPKITLRPVSSFCIYKYPYNINK